MDLHRKIIGTLHLCLGIFALVPVMILTALFGGIWGIAAFATHGHEATTILGIGLATILAIVIASVAIAATLGIAAGTGVLLGHKWGDVLATVLAVVHVFNVPFGTALAAYTVWGLWLESPAPLRAFPKRDGVQDLQTSP